MRAIRAIDRFKSLAIVAVTGKATAGERQRCLDAGANDYVPKPVDSAELLSSLRPWLPATRRPAQPAPPAEVVPSQAEPARTQTVSISNGSDSNGRTEIPLDGLTILVVDDDFRNIFAMTALLERGRAHVVVAESGAEAITALESTPGIDLVLMDIMMPVMDGYDAMRAIRAIDRFKSLPIIAVTGKAGSGERQRCLDAGANDYIPKPVDSNELLTALRPWLSVRTAAV
jgi:CheY-like chemotaxis protein